jgi:hypothetical protein
MAARNERRAAVLAPERVALKLDGVVTHHLDGFRSGVARFNELLAERLRVPLLSVFDERLGELAHPLLSFKVSELSDREHANLTQIVDERTWRGEIYLHAYSGDRLERRLIKDAVRVHCGNAEIAEQVAQLNKHVDTLWTPGLIEDDRTFEPTQISVFSFGMAHKIRTDMFRRLRELLESAGQSYTLYVSTANHETASMRDAELVFREMHEIFPRGLYFMGNLSDVAVYNQLTDTTFFAAFFENGVRANNTSVASAMERGAVVITNLDRYSPPELRHMENIIDIDCCESLPLDLFTLKTISVNAMRFAAGRSWDELTSRLAP